MTDGINSGGGLVVNATGSVVEAARNAGESAAREFERVGDAIIDAIIQGVESGQSQLIAAVVRVVEAAIAAGLAEARQADTVGLELIRAITTEMGAGRSALDSAGVSAGNALIDGMVRAILAGKSRLINAIRDAINAAVAAAKAALGIASPSRVADDLLTNFMRTATDTVAGLSRPLAAAVARAMSGAAGAAAAGLGAANLTPRLTPLMDTAGLSGRAAAIPTGRIAGRPMGDGGYRNQVVIYGDLVLPGVVDSRSLLEELDALGRAG